MGIKECRWFQCLGKLYVESATGKSQACGPKIPKSAILARIARFRVTDPPQRPLAPIADWVKIRRRAIRSRMRPIRCHRRSSSRSGLVLRLMRQAFTVDRVYFSRPGPRGKVNPTIRSPGKRLTARGRFQRILEPPFAKNGGQPARCGRHVRRVWGAGLG